MILEIIAAGVLATLLLPMFIFGGFTFQVGVWEGMTNAVEYFNTFLMICPPLVIVFKLFVYGLLLELILIVLKVMLGNKTPTLN